MRFLTWARYDNKVRDLQRELEQRGGPSQAPPHGGPPHGPAQPAPPVIGHGPRDLFGGIIAGAGGVQGAPALGPPPLEPQQPQGMPAQLTQAAGMPAGPQPGQHPPFASYQPNPGANGELPSDVLAYRHA